MRRVPQVIPKPKRKPDPNPTPPPTLQLLRCMDLYAGAGGLGYLDHADQLPDGQPDPLG